ncbi:PTS sugar transporter subunit IIB [Enterococcus sp. UD-01]|jgi:PTS system cellobiose-specific IIB component|uniref:PTS sugar transporter subunit IIB n=1 Tax=Enterococcus sp. UD-01 TaxID=3373911 RepID=UPI003833B919
MKLERLHVLLVCNLGYSTGIMVTKMREVAEGSKALQGTDVKIEAHPAGELREHIENFDVVMLGPQIKHQLAELTKLADQYGKPIAVIDSKDYGRVDGGNILKAAILLKLNAENTAV